MIDTRFDVDCDGNLIVHRIDEDISPVLDLNHALRTSGDGYTPSRDLRYVAQIPPIVIEIWRNQYGLNVHDPNDRKMINRLLNSNEFYKLRTSEGRI